MQGGGSLPRAVWMARTIVEAGASVNTGTESTELTLDGKRSRRVANAKNIAEYYKRKGQTALIEIVAYGPGLHMLRAPVKDRIGPMALENPNLKFIACGDTQAGQSKAEGKEVPLIGEATVMPPRRRAADGAAGRPATPT